MDPLTPFSPAVRAWFAGSFAAPTRAQSEGFGPIAAGAHTLLSAPTGSGKTLAAFLVCIDRLGRELAPPRGVRVLYVSPLKALAYDVERNLRAPLAGVLAAAERLGVPQRALSVSLRTGDTPARERRRLLREPGEILVTTPESLYLLLGSRAREVLRTVDTVIVDEIHALAPSKRGVHLALSLERLVALTGREPQRIGLSATQRPLDEVARYLAGDRETTVVDASERPRIDLTVEVPLDEAIEGRLLELIRAHRSTLIFCNSRRLCERLAQRLNERAGEELVRAHHGSIAPAQRQRIEELLKRGELRGLVATSSLELGIDMSAIDLAIQVESPGTVARGLQRIGRAGHQVGARSEGRIFPKHRADLLEATVVARGMLAGDIEPLSVPENTLDVLAQQIVAMCSVEELSVAELWARVRRAHSFRALSREALESVLDMLSGRYPSDEFADLRPRLVWDRARDRLVTRRDARLIAIANAGTIPDRGLYGVYLGEGGPRLGELDEEMVHESRVGQTFLLGASTWRIVAITRDRVEVQPAPGEPGRMPFWRGEGAGRPSHLGRAIGAFTRELGERSEADACASLERHPGLDARAARNLWRYLDEQKRAGVLPTDRTIAIERFRDELGDFRVCILSPFGARVHAPWALALEARLAAQAGFAVETLYSDDGIALRFADHSAPLAAAPFLFAPEELEELVLRELSRSALFATRFRENASRALLLPRRRLGGRTPLWSQRLRAQTLLGSALRHPRFPIVLETYRECLKDVFDLPALVGLMTSIREGEVRVLQAETAGPSPFARSLTSAWAAAYLYQGDSPLAERKAQALTLDRDLLRELCGPGELARLLDPGVLDELQSELQSLVADRRVRSADGLHDLLRRVGPLDRAELSRRSARDPAAWLDELAASGRVLSVPVAERACLIAVEDVARYRDALGVVPPPGIPDAHLPPPEPPAAALESLVRRFARVHGPFSASELAAHLGLVCAEVHATLAALVVGGRLLEGEFQPEVRAQGSQQFCDAEVLRLLRKRTLAKLRREVAPVEPAVLARFLVEWQGVGSRRGGLARLAEVLDQLEGLPLPVSEIERTILPARVSEFEPRLLDELCASGERVWIGRGALGPSDGWVAIYRRDRLPLLDLAIDQAAALEPAHRAVLETLASRGASFFRELTAAVAAPEEALLSALWDLVWAGRVTNDTFAPLRALGAPARAPRLLVSGTGRASGRWTLPGSLAAPPTPTESAHARARMLLDRYGVVSREAALAEALPGGFGALAPVLRALEDTGKVRRGHFVEGGSGPQYAHADAVDRLRAARDTGGAVVLAAVDPANPYGSILAWPSPGPCGADEVAHPRRVAGAKVALARGVPIFYLESGGKKLRYFAGAADGEAAIEALRALCLALSPGRSRRIESINGVPSLRSEHAHLLERVGFRVEPGGLVPP